MILNKLLLSAALCLGALPASAQQSEAADRLTATVRTLASDAFEGRAPGSAGEKKTIDYLVARFQALGLAPAGSNGSWVQPVPLLHTQLKAAERLAFRSSAMSMPLKPGEDIYLSTIRPDDVAQIDAPIVFVGYGVHAPERDWDDFKGVDVRGKVVVFLVNDPDFEAKSGEAVRDRFGGRTMTYYGRWTYKFEEAARRGAVGALIVHDTAGAGYGWNVVVSPGGENYDIVRKPADVTSNRLQGWLSDAAARRLFASAGLDLDALKVAARTPSFRPVALEGVRFEANIPVAHEVITSHNVLARIPGTDRSDEIVMFGAHWDAYGKGKPDAEGHVYRAGANDDALGIAGLLEIARAMKADPPPRRSVVFAAWTAEERGLLGSEFYATNPVYPLDKTVANLTLDILQTAGPANDVVLVGIGQNSLEDDMARVAGQQGRRVTPESLPERGLFYRADHFSFAKRGVPVLLIMGIAGASDLKQGGVAAGQAWIDRYTGSCYHQACDRWSPQWNLDGALQDISLVGAIGSELARSQAWPTWKAGSEFLKLRKPVAPAKP
ncbi:M28 family metallopeptidase [Sphingomonas psychrotolerans]|uniref:M28 family metallopeptidase n=1 Tax=Sphingomonas psychrotolerans TaxID=1327635 RepID=A0ABU3N536_9SPHN|nr:M28 family metallopeptidase [Sphingomonas psychrotolerans]MDT8759634.1 M28 family metallopeptidase [Sphingomonas psychrotolerans]